MTMKICLYYKPIDKPWGGTNSFILSLKEFFRNKGIEITHDIDSDYDILFLNSAYKAPGELFTKKDIVIFEAKKGRIVYRLDGLRKVYIQRSKGGLKRTLRRLRDKLIGQDMDDLQRECIKLADRVVFQSKYARQMFEKHKYYEGNNYKIINNGVNQNIFNLQAREYWNGRGVLKIIACSWSPNPNKGHKIIAEFSALKGAEVCFIGKWPKEVDLPSNIRKLDTLSQEEIAKEFKQHHIFLFPSLREACSNILLEALSSGLPVLYANSGSNEEIAGKYGVALKGNLQESLDLIRANYSALVENIKCDIKKFSIESAGEQYLKVCRSIAGGTNL